MTKIIKILNCENDLPAWGTEHGSTTVFNFQYEITQFIIIDYFYNIYYTQH